LQINKNSPAAMGRPLTDAQDILKLTPDELILIMACTRSGGAGDFDLWMAERSNIGDDFNAPTNLSELNTESRENGGSLSSDGLVIAYAFEKVCHVCVRIIKRPLNLSVFSKKIKNNPPVFR
jgi:hypothetical protein